MGIKQRIQRIDWINHAYTNYKWRERKVSFGKENPDKEIYVARRANSKAGLFSLVLTSLGQITYAEERGYVPAVDLSSYRDGYLGSNEITGNVWDYYFEQPAGIEFSEVMKSKNVILGNGIISDELSYPKDVIAYDEEELRYWKKKARKYLVVKRGIWEEALQQSEKLFSNKRILGVLARGTDYINARPSNHPIQPTVYELMKKVDEVWQTGKYERIYLATEDRKFHKEFKEKYGNKLLSLDTKRYETIGSENINDIRKADGMDGYNLGKDYLITIVLLSMCNALIAGNTSGSLGALLLNEEYEYRYIFNLGLYD